MPRTVAVIPARYGSSRLPGKPLAMIGVKPMIRHVWENASESGLFDEVVVATDDERIESAVRGFGGTVVMTRGDHPSGTDRVAEVARGLDADVIVNLQGDLPFAGRALLEPAVAALRDHAAIRMATLSVPITDRKRFLDPNVVKVVTDQAGFALYFSRAPIPVRREAGSVGGDSEELGRQHVGLYVFRRELLFELASWSPTPLERLERLEQLRALERGVKLYVAKTGGPVVEVDTLEDLRRAGGETS
jgi:3-deoxy-manno-octulosonate cytidylyltransferase (CMP-KDO synthetase)